MKRIDEIMTTLRRNKKELKEKFAVKKLVFLDPILGEKKLNQATLIFMWSLNLKSLHLVSI